MKNLFCFTCDHKFTDQEIINYQFNICCNPNCKNLLCDYCGIMSTIMINENNEIICNCNNIFKIMMLWKLMRHVKYFLMMIFRGIYKRFIFFY